MALVLLNELYSKYMAQLLVFKFSCMEEDREHMVIKCPKCDRYIVVPQTVETPTCYHCGYSNEVTY